MIMTKNDCKKAMALNPELAAKLCYKAEMVSSLTDRIDSIDRLAPENIGSRQRAWNLRKQVQIEMLQVLGALAGEYKKTYGENLYSEYVDYRNYERLTGEARIDTITKMCQILNVADECCREAWADYLEAEGDTYLTKQA
ncbi:hypothetical protein [Butyrivibrio sp.]|uniref:hypothetical protein n=1 Tax=Butyrivibrio sp. TaxID=28121 RepID=UPI0025C73B4D|nr:hypothetical protein [Butyrivibrio sp.]MBQ7430211.1 hypothetical protein [Butyrivibrio sp.]MBQ9303386.1 hypothetical protein [Butyrivibrio sp.]